MELLARKYILILGNGFDLDLGFKTKYTDFLNSNFWPLKSTDQDSRRLIPYLENQSKEKTCWFDIEELIREYARLNDKIVGGNRSATEIDKKEFEELRSGLSSFIQNQTENEEITHNFASQVFSSVLRNGNYTIFTFNYSKLDTIAKRMGINIQGDYRYVHGKAEDNSIIMGVDDRVELKKGFEFMRKTFSPFYESHPIQYSMMDAEEIIIFGHSLGEIDYPYFETYFQSLCDANKDKAKMRKITIFTYDEDSRLQILNQLWHMNNKRTNYLFGLNDVKFICTSPKERGRNKEKFQALLQHINETSIEQEKLHLQSITNDFL